MEPHDKELTSLEALFPSFSKDEICHIFERATPEFRVVETLESLFNSEQVRDEERLMVEDRRYAQMIHNLFPVYSVHKILKKLKKYQYCVDRWKIIVVNILKHAKKECVSGVKRKLSGDNVEEGCSESKRVELDNEESDENGEVSTTSSAEQTMVNETCLNDGFISRDSLCDTNKEVEAEREDQLKVNSPEKLSDKDVGSCASDTPNETEITYPDNTEDIRSEIDRLLASVIDSPLKAEEDKIKDQKLSVWTDQLPSLDEIHRLPHSYLVPESSQDKKRVVDQIPGPSSYYPEKLDETMLPPCTAEGKGKSSLMDCLQGPSTYYPLSGNGADELLNSTPLEIKLKKLEELMPPPTTTKPHELKRSSLNSNITKIQDIRQSTVDAIPGPSTYDPYQGKNASRLRRRQHFDLLEYLVYSTGVSATSVANFCQKNGIDVYRERNQAELEGMIREILNAEIEDLEADDSIICLDDASFVSCEESPSSKPLTFAPKKKRRKTEDESLNGPVSNGQVIDGSNKIKSSISSKVLSQVLDVFPDVDPDFVRKMYEDLPMMASSEAAIIDTLIENLLGAEYPKRPKRAPSPVQPVDPEEQLAFIKELLPDADPTFLQMKVAQLTPDELKNFVGEALETKNYPTLKEYLRNQQLSSQTRQYTTRFSVENYVKLVQDPVQVFTDPKRTVTLNREDVFYVEMFFRNKFNRLPVRLITSQLSRNNQRVYQTDKDLIMFSTEPKNLLKSKRVPVNLTNMVCKNIPLLQELAFIEHEEQILKYIEQLKLDKEQERKNAKEQGLMQVCSCCYEDEVMPDEAYCCENGCVCCKQCIVRSSEVAFGEGKLEFPCLGDCKVNFSLPMLQRFLPPNLFSKIAQKKAVQEIKAAGMEDLEFCPFCDFASIPSGPPETNKIFTCQNPECLKESCRLCKESSHVPLRCEEVEKDEDVKKRVFIENKMTEALLRKCWKCGISFYKEEGCNKMTCSCGALMCYVCGKPVTDYKHFNGIGGDNFELCPLYSDTLKMNQQNVLKGAQKAKEEIGVNQAELKIDPTSDIEQFYQDRAKRVPREPYLEQLEPRNAMNMHVREAYEILYLVNGELQLQRRENMRVFHRPGQNQRPH